VNREERRRAKAEAKRRLREDGKDQDPLAMKQRALLVMTAIEKGTEEYLRDFESRHPRLFGEAMVSLARYTFESLRARLEDPEEEAVTWREPFLEVRFPVAFHQDDGPIPLTMEEPGVSVSDFTDENWRRLRKSALDGTEDPLFTGALAQFSELIFHARELAFFATVTHGTAFFKEGEEYTAHALKNWAPDPPEGASPEELQAAFEKLCQPFVLSGPPPGEGFRLSGTVDEKPFTGSVVFEVHPLVVDVNEEEAFYPVIGGLVLEGEGGDPSAWSEEDRGVFWTALFEEMDKLAESLRSGDETGTTSETGTIGLIKGTAAGHSTATGRLEAFPEATVYTTPPPERRSLAMGLSRVDRRSMELIGHLANLQGLPKKLSRVRKYDELVQEEVERLQEEHGEDAFKDLRVVLKDGNARGRLLERNHKTGQVTLTREAEAALLDGLGTRWVRRFVEEGGVRREYLEGRKRAGTGTVTFGLSWHGSAYLLIEEGRKKLQEELPEEDGQGDLFEDKRHEETERTRRLLRSIQDAHLVMEFVTNELGREGRNPVTIPAWMLRTLLRCEGDGREGYKRAQDCLHALRELRCRMDSAGTGGPSFSYAGQFLSGFWELRRGPGEHTDGDFKLEVSESFVGCLAVFKAAPHRLKEAGLVHLLDWNKKLSKEEKAELKRGKGFVQGLNLSPFWDAAKGFTPAQSGLRRFILGELTRKKDAASKRGERVRPDHPEAMTPRLYGRDFCPLLPEERLFCGALGHFQPHQRPERGRTLIGTRREATKTGGAHVGGLLEAMGYSFPPGAARKKRGEVVRQALEDFQTVVVEAFGGVIAARLKTSWLTLEEATRLSETELRRVCWLFFVPQDFESRVAADIEKDAAERHAQGEAPYLVTVDKTGDGRDHGPERLPLHVRLRLARKERGLRQGDVGKLFGVSQRAVSQWEEGTDPDAETGKAPGKPIPGELAPLVTRWVETGEPPRPEELAARRTRRQGVNPETGKPWKVRDEAES